MQNTAETLWQIIDSRDACYLAAQNLFRRWISELETSVKSLQKYLDAVESDRDQRLAAIERLQHELDLQGAARHAAEAKLAELEPALAGTRQYLSEVEIDRAARLQSINELREAIAQQSTALQSATSYISQIESDRDQRLAAIERLQHELDLQGAARHAAEAKLAELEPALAGTRQYLSEVEIDRAARLTAIYKYQQQVQETDVQLGKAMNTIASLRYEISELMKTNCNNVAKIEHIQTLLKSNIIGRLAYRLTDLQRFTEST
jgi:chromosome segregation ATPase